MDLNKGTKPVIPEAGDGEFSMRQSSCRLLLAMATLCIAVVLAGCSVKEDTTTIQPVDQRLAKWLQPRNAVRSLRLQGHNRYSSLSRDANPAAGETSPTGFTNWHSPHRDENRITSRHDTVQVVL